MQELVTVIATWLSVSFGLPAMQAEPKVAFVPEEEMLTIRLGDAYASAALGDAGVYAIYEDATGTIFFGQDWSASSTADISVLVHELVHHLQNEAGLVYDCPEEREELAYRAQQQ